MPIFSDLVKDVLARRKLDVCLEEAAYHAYQRIRYFNDKARLKTLDHTCLDLAHAGTYLDNLLYHRYNFGNPAAYKLVYNMGLELIDHLAVLEETNLYAGLIDVIGDLVDCYNHHKSV